MRFCATCAFGFEAMVKNECQTLGFELTGGENGKVFFDGDFETMMKANLSLRTAEHVYLVLKEEKITTFDALFDLIKAVDFRAFIRPEGQFIVNAKSHKSTLFSLRDIQKITKKAWIENLKHTFDETTFLEKGPQYNLLIVIDNDQCSVLLDTSGDALHKRGYRENQGKAPLKETLAAALIMQSFYRADRILIDPFCGSGTIAIEAALMAKNIAPNINRSFAFEAFKRFDHKLFKNLKRQYLKAIKQDEPVKIIASDIDPKMVEMAKDNAFNAGVDDAIHFKVSDFKYMDYTLPYAIVITNPPYGQRLEEEKNLKPLYEDLGKVIKKHPDNSYYIFTSFMGFEKTIGNYADKTRVLFNGRIKSRLYQYFGPKPPV